MKIFDRTNRAHPDAAEQTPEKRLLVTGSGGGNGLWLTWIWPGMKRRVFYLTIADVEALSEALCDWLDRVAPEEETWRYPDCWMSTRVLVVRPWGTTVLASMSSVSTSIPNPTTHLSSSRATPWGSSPTSIS